MSPASNNAQLPVVEGDTVDDKYRVGRLLGVGGMGAVVEATHLKLGHRVAIKFLVPEIAKGGVAVERFLREARAAARLRSEHVAHVMDVGALSDGTPFMVLEYLEGHDLAAVIESRGPLPVSLAVDYVLQACDAILEAHSLGIIHRDLKPRNLFLTTRPNGTALVKVLDFGISKSTTELLPQDASLTRTSDVVGSPLFMAPEQIRDAREVDARTDIWALGVILYELVSGRLPFEANTLPRLCSLVLEEEPPALESVREGVPQSLGLVVKKCLQKHPEQRYPDIDSLVRALRPLVSPTSEPCPALEDTLAPEATSAERGSLGTLASESARRPAESANTPSATHDAPITLGSNPETPPQARSYIAIAVVGLTLLAIGLYARSYLLPKTQDLSAERSAVADSGPVVPLSAATTAPVPPAPSEALPATAASPSVGLSAPTASASARPPRVTRSQATSPGAGSGTSGDVLPDRRK